MRQETVSETGVLEEIAWFGTWEDRDPDGGKEAWGPGPWADEADKVQWIDKATGLDCLIVRGPLGQLCGYVGVEAGHPLHGIHYNVVEEQRGFLEVHGGLTFSDSCMEDAPEGTGVCHIPFPGRSDAVWWFGFDCGHHMDYVPAMEYRLARSGIAMPTFPREGELRRALGVPEGPLPPGRGKWGESYKTVPYVRAEVERLAGHLQVKGLPA